ncbi:FecCD family ABC transporter permease [Listeria fleischmannii]|jgi:iron complex transport system permease protein|uniref:FecCD family ABC transporter permease n=2 Tax=Listeria fleischmannii TaxID=1069827 RepID=UPI000E047A01|nr:iron ABC transporter permease [Listeria fleischmannii]MBC1418671.1 iron ABC transporter permease [Listeria fleischmannii]STY35673.1 Iron-uptake system permease protein FeuB [Listeria fleischmannii subsp. coloradonensis]
MSVKIPIWSRFVLVFLLLIAMFGLALSFGSVHYSFGFLIDGFFHGQNQKEITTLYELRLPRNIAAILIGAALGVSGSIMQALTRNPLADPGILGVSAGGNLSLALIIAFMPNLAFPGKMLASFLGAAAGTLFVLAISKQGNIYKIILAGAAVSAFLTAIASAVSILFKTSKEMNMWTSGGLVGTTFHEVALIAPVILLALVVSLFFSKQIGILTMSDEVAVGLGISIQRMRLLLFFFVAILTGASVALIGEIAFVGLIVPHFARFIVGANYKYILPMSALVGALFLLIADTLSRTLNPPFEIPIVAILSVIGLPFFIYIVRGGLKG